MNIKKINNEDDYKKAIKYLEELGDNPNFEKDINLQKEFEFIEKLVENYDNEHYPIEKGDPIEIIKLKMRYMGLKQKDLIPAIGSKGVVSEVLNKKRQLSKKMIRELSKLLKISQEILNTEYELLDCKKIIKEKTSEENIKFDIPKLLQPHISNLSYFIYKRQAFYHVCIY